MGLLEDLAGALPADRLVTDPDSLDAYARDHAPWVPAGVPAAAVKARSIDHVQAAVRVAAQHGAPVVARGAGSGLSGGANAIDGCVVISMVEMDRILAVEPADLVAEVEPGVLNAAVDAAAAEHGLWYAPDPASRDFSTIGGNIATNAGGLCCVKYGVTRDHVLGLDVVLADGTLARMGRRTVKGVTGLDLTSLFVGSEGTLGIVVGARLRLRPRPAPSATVAALFPTVHAAGVAIAAIATAGVTPSLLELMDRTTINAVEDWQAMGLDREAGALVLARSDLIGSGRDDEARLIGAACEAAGATDVFTTTEVAEGEQFLHARRIAAPALERIGPMLLDDVGVPRSKVPDLVVAVERIAERRDVVIATFGHAGDGNLHPNILVAPGEEGERRAQAAFDDILDTALDMGGTVTGEHGVGLLKLPYLERELGSRTVAAQRAVKAALDPQGIMNPGKAI